MKFSKLLLFGIFLIGISSVHAQQKTNLSLKDAVEIALSKSDEVGLATTKSVTRSYELSSVKNNQYPDVKISGQYLRLTNADIKLKSSGEASSDPDAEPAATPKVNQLMFGQASVSMPLFSGFKLRNSIKASESQYKAELANASYTKEETAMKVVSYYADLYKAQKSVELFKESLKSGQQRVTDFTAMEQNGIIARNDLLKAQLQVSKYQLSLDDAEKNVRLINYYLVTLLKLSPETQISVSPESIQNDLFSFNVQTEAEALQSRKDMEALSHLENASKSEIKVAQSGYYPALSLTGGYVAMDIQNVVRVENAMNVGVGLSYNLSSIFKNGKEVKAAKSRAQEVEQQKAILTDRIKEQIMEAKESYDLSMKQDKVYTEAVGQADENFRIVKDKYDNGLSDTNDLLEADVEDLSAKINLAYAKANVVLKYYELLDASGQLTQSFNLTTK
ncbi:transporter [Flavobacterium noncentrifugens]|uniref:Outer membrane protein TolC n=1 Tax=Flavobacterium noncentrifugens TaxID=1128970 RepID=A0A1G8W5F8_9FLAO|nr:TolC family protein [Flavobacterium noncentrifugens]GEP50775.1 transporter [Flavobacterium noncentrifugens]SDJ73317.1 Outer membrane protein TolC [Flavobacterium noncentrifugens]